MYVCTRVKYACLMVVAYIATKVFIGNLPAKGRGVDHHRVGQ